jgi:hypothetical protein
MNPHLQKTFVVSVVSFVLLYYSVAWVVLQCSHEENHSDHAAALYDTDVHGNNAYRPSPSHPETHIDCLNLTYHTESLAGPTSPSQLQGWATHMNSHVTNFLSSPTMTKSWARDFWLGAVFERLPGLTFFVDPRLYLSLSILRI